MISKQRQILLGLLIVALTLVAYARVFAAGWIWDDPDYVVNNYTLRDTAGLRDIWLHPTSIPQWYPLVHTTFWMEYQWWGTTSAGYHAVNVLLHALNALLVWRILSRLNIRGCWLAAAIFAVHPVMVESVAWVTERKNVLSLLFCLLSLRAYLFSFVPTRRGPIWLAAFALFVCALLSKSVTATMPAVILVILWWRNGRIAWRDLMPLLPFFMVAAAMGSWTAWLEVHHVGADGSKIVELRFDFLQRIYIAGRAVWFYAAKLLWPSTLTFIYPRWESIDRSAPWLIIFPSALLGLLIALLLLRNRLGRGPLALVLIYCVALAPALGFVAVYPMRFSFVADHFQYHASIAMIVLIASLIAQALKRELRVLVVPLLIALMVLTFRQSAIYDNAVSLWTATLPRNPRSWMVNTNLARALSDRGEIDAAAPFYLRALELAPNIHDTHTNAGNVFGRRGDYARAVGEFQQALAINPDFAPAYYGWGQVLEHQGKLDEALATFNRALQIAPHYPEANFRAGLILEQKGDVNAAIDHYRVAVTYNPGYVEARYNLGAALLKLKQYDEAIANLYDAVRLDPMNVQAWTNLGAAQLLTGHLDDAVGSFQRALQLRPGFAPAEAGLRQAMRIQSQLAPSSQNSPGR